MIIPLVQVFGHLEVSEDRALVILNIANIFTTAVLTNSGDMHWDGDPAGPKKNFIGTGGLLAHMCKF